MKNLAERYGPWAVVIGASSGIGVAFARRLAADGVNVVLAARRLDRLQALADELEVAHGIEARAVEADLSSREGVDAIDKATADIGLSPRALMRCESPVRSWSRGHRRRWPRSWPPPGGSRPYGSSLPGPGAG